MRKDARHSLKKPAFILGAVLCMAFAAVGTVQAQCYGSLALPSGTAELDHVVRLSVHFGDVSLIPRDIVCSRTMLGSETTLDVPIYAYNLHEGVQYLEFSISSNDSVSEFAPAGCFIVLASYHERIGESYRIDLALQACGPTCGPLRIGTAKIVRGGAEPDPIWVDLLPNGQTGMMFALDSYGQIQSLYSPQHGGFIGQGYLYSCQPPLCPEPNAAVQGFSAEKMTGCAVKLAWVAGGGNRTMIRFRTDRFPTDYRDGGLVAEVASSPGEDLSIIHEGFPEPATLYYKAFSLTRNASDLVTSTSFVECSSVDTVSVNCEIATRPESWGAIKSLFR